MTVGLALKAHKALKVATLKRLSKLESPAAVTRPAHERAAPKFAARKHEIEIDPGLKSGASQRSRPRPVIPHQAVQPAIMVAVIAASSPKESCRQSPRDCPRRVRSS